MPEFMVATHINTIISIDTHHYVCHYCIGGSESVPDDK